MLLSLDAHYAEHAVQTACVGFAAWPDAVSAVELVVRSTKAPEAYEPGQFYKRELPYLLSALEQITRARLETVVIDGHVWLAAGKPGLGAHLFDALGGEVPVIGVAKSAFSDAATVSVVRGESRRPLFVTAIGMDPMDAARAVESMHGPYRIPTLLKRTDQLARGIEPPRRTDVGS